MRIVRALRLRGVAPLLAAVAFAVSGTGCNQLSRLLSGTGPAPASAPWRKNVPAWSPYVVLQPDAGAVDGYREALSSLAATGALQGVRIPLFADGRSVPVVAEASSFNLDVLGIVDNADLFRSDLEAMFDQYRAVYPQVRVFQVGNEITTATPSMSAAAYVDVLARVYAHVASADPDVTLLAEATFGAGTIGADDLSAMVPAFHARGLSPSRLILGLNVYTNAALVSDAAALSTVAGGYRVWVTETGTPDQASQLSYVSTTYPQIAVTLGAQRIYWYALWAGDAGGDSGYSLIKGADNPPIVPGPLFQQLTATN